MPPQLEKARRSTILRQPSEQGALSHLLGIYAPRGTSESTAKQWESLSVISALLTGVAAAGLFVTAEVVQNFAEAAKEPPKLDNSTSPWMASISESSFAFGWAKVTMMAWCIDTFCFLNSTVLSCFFVAFQKRHCDVLVDVEMMIDALGWWAFHSPRIYFRTGYYLMVVSFSMFFMMVMSPFETLGCLAFCTALIIGPMFFFMNVSLATFNVTDEALKRAQTRRQNAVKL